MSDVESLSKELHSPKLTISHLTSAKQIREWLDDPRNERIGSSCDREEILRTDEMWLIQWHSPASIEILAESPYSVAAASFERARKEAVKLRAW